MKTRLARFFSSIVWLAKRHPIVTGMVLMFLLCSIPFVSHAIEELVNFLVQLIGIVGTFFVARLFLKR